MKTPGRLYSILLLLVVSCGGGGSDPAASPAASYWNMIDWKTADGGVYAAFTYDGLSPSCSNNPMSVSADFNFFARYGTANNLVVYFQGGGACWDVNNCITEPTYSYEMQYFETENILDLISSGQARAYDYSGIFDFTAGDNPFSDWSFVYIPYCTGDLFWGAQDTAYGMNTIRHRGQVNFRLVLEWLKDHFIMPPERILVAGISGGAYGAVFNFPYIRETFPASDVFLLGDAGNGVVTDGFRTNGLPNWDVHLPVTAGFDDFSGVDPSTLSITDIYGAIANHYTDSPFGQYTTAWDENQTFFYNVMLNIANPGVDGENWNDITQGTVWCDWHDAMLANRDATAGTIAGTGTYHYFIAPGDVHTILFSNGFYTVSSNGVMFIDWVRAMINGGPAFDNVMCTGECGKPPDCPACP